MKTKRVFLSGVLASAILALTGCSDSGPGTSCMNPPLTNQPQCFMWGSNLTGDQAKQCCYDPTPPSSPKPACAFTSITTGTGQNRRTRQTCPSPCVTRYSGTDRYRHPVACVDPPPPPPSCNPDPPIVWIPKANPPAGACPTAPAFGATTSTMASFTAAANTATTALATADQLAKGSITAANGVAASAATAAGPNSGGNGGSQGPSLGASLHFPGPAALGAGTNAPAAGGGGGSGSGFGSGTTVATKAAVDVANQQLGNTETASAVMGGGGGGGGGKHGGGGGANSGLPDFSGLFGGGKADAGRGGAGSMDFGGHGPSDNSMTSADPVDYFTLTRAEDNIFKIVERRYGAKAKSWAIGDAKNASISAQQLAK